MIKSETCNPIQINIFGSCVTRDVFAFQENQQFTVGEYIARQSVVSFLSKPFPFDESCIHLSSAFQRKQILSDLNKDGFTRLKNNPGDYLIIDLIEERFKIGKICDAYFTDSNELDASGFFDQYKAKLYESRMLHGKVFFRCRNMAKYISGFAEQLLKLYKPEQIIIHEIYLATHFLDQERQVQRFPENYVRYAQTMNEKLTYMYQYLKKRLPKTHCIAVSNHFLADQNHKWGLAPMHFQAEYYRTVLEELHQFLP